MVKFLKSCFVGVLIAGAVTGVAFWSGLQSFVFAWVLNFALMTGVLYGTQTFKPALQSTYYNTKRWEEGGKVYKWFGIHLFRKILVWTGWEKLHKANSPVERNLDALKHLEYNTRQSEFGHLIIFFIVLIFFLFVLLYHGIIQSLWLLVLNVILNVYPIGVQRYNRPRLNRAIKSSSQSSKI